MTVCCHLSSPSIIHDYILTQSSICFIIWHTFFLDFPQIPSFHRGSWLITPFELDLQLYVVSRQKEGIPHVLGQGIFSSVIFPWQTLSNKKDFKAAVKAAVDRGEVSPIGVAWIFYFGGVTKEAVKRYRKTVCFGVQWGVQWAGQEHFFGWGKCSLCLCLAEISC